MQVGYRPDRWDAFSNSRVPFWYSSRFYGWSSPRYGSVRFPLLGNKLITGDGKKALKMVNFIQSSKNVSLKEAPFLLQTRIESGNQNIKLVGIS